MKRIYNAANLPEAYLVRDMLIRAGVPAHVFNENAVAAFGEIPVAATYPQIWIAQPHQEQHARSIIASYEKRPAPTHSLKCNGCGEHSPGQFEICWSCGANLGLEA